MRKKTLIVAIIVFLLDFVSKFFIFKFLPHDLKRYIINNFFAIYPIRNYGAAFSLFSDSNLLLISISVIILIYLLVLINKQKDKLINYLSYGLLIGGLFGNLYDRLIYKYVRDFISFTFFDWEFAIFNVADIAICIGVGLILIQSLFKEKKHENS